MSANTKAIVDLHHTNDTYEIDRSDDDRLFQEVNQPLLGFKDLEDGIMNWRIWMMLAYQDIKLRYRRSILGPFWITISMAITVYCMGFIYSHLFHQDLQTYYPFLVGGMLGWSLISTLVMEYTEGLTSAEGFLKGLKLPYSLLIHRIAMRNIFIFFHNILVIVPILILFHEKAKVNLNTLLLIPGLFIIYVNSISFGLMISLISARYRDVAQIIKNLVQVVFFVTPIMWQPSLISTISHWIVDLNPFYAFIELIRAPLIGTTPTINNVINISIVTVIGFLLSTQIFFRYRSRIIYWL